MTKRGWILFSSLCVIWGIPYLLIRVAVTDLDPVFVAFARTAIGTLVLLPIALRRRALMPVLRRWPILLLYTLVEITGPWILLGHAEVRLTSSTAGLLVAVVPLIGGLLLWATGHERFDTRRVLGLILGFAGVAVLVGVDINLDDLTAVGMVLLTALGYAIGPIIISRKLSDLPPTGVITASLVLAAVIYAPFAAFAWPATIPLNAGLSVLGLGLICTALAFILLFALIAEAGPARATVITYVNPAVAILLGVLILSEPLTIGMAIGFPLVILGSVLATAKSRSSKKSAADLPADPSAAALER
ncbi:DMT family transporter [Nakamurella silvestris]|nr:DMT family transporter [Nakamurella silvestris]